MMKRLLIYSSVVFVLLLAALLVWQPESLQRAVLDRVIAQVEKNSPYKVSVESIGGNFFTNFSLQDISVRPRGGPSPVLTAEALRLGIHWSALLRKQISIQEIVFVNPSLDIAMDKNKTLIFPPLQRPSDPSKEGWPLSVRVIRVEKGRLRFTNHSLRPAGRLQFEEINLQARLTPQELQLENFSLALGSGTMQVQGEVALKSLTGRLAWRQKTFPIDDLLAAVVALPTALEARFSGQGALERRTDSWHVGTSGRLNDSELDLSGRVQQNGPYRVQLRLEDLALTRLWRHPASKMLGTFSARMQASAPGLRSQRVDSEGEMHITAALPVPSSSPLVTAQWQLAAGDGQIQVRLQDQGLVADATAHFNLVREIIEGHYQLAFSDLQRLAVYVPGLAHLQGRLNGEGSVEGPLRSPSIHTQAKVEALRWQETHLEQASLQMTGRLGAGHSLSIQMAAREVQWRADRESPWDLQQLTAEVHGKKPAWEAKLHAQSRSKAVFDYAGSIHQLTAGWRVGWERLVLQPPEGAPFQAIESGNVTFREDIILHNLALAHGSGRLHMPQGRFGKQFMNGSLRLEQIPLASVHSLIPGTTAYEGLLNGSIDWRGRYKVPEGEVHLQVVDGRVKRWNFKNLQLAATLEPPWILIPELVAEVDTGSSTVRARGRLPMHLINADLPNLPLHVQISAPQLDPQILTAFSPGLELDQGGTARLDLTMSGRYPDIQMEGEFKANLPRLAMKSAGLELRDLIADIRSTKSTVTIHQLTAKTKQGSISVSGESNLPRLQFVVRGEDVIVNLPKRLYVEGNMDLLIHGKLQRPEVSGEVRLKEGTYTVVREEKKHKKKDKNKEAEPAAPSRDSVWYRTAMDIQAQWPRNVWYRDGLSKIETSADLRVQKAEGMPMPYLTGQIVILRGTYDAYGRDFILDSGALVFTGPPEINPLLNLRAQYKSGGVIVFLDVKGTAKAPLLKLSSNPPLPEQDIVSVLVFGRPLNEISPQVGQAGDADSPSARAQAGALAGNVLSGYITKELRESGLDLMGLDVVRIEPTGQGTRLTVGRYIGEDLFVSYGQPLQASVGRVFNADYYLSKRWTIQAQTGTTLNSYLDFQFRYPLNSPDYIEDKGRSAFHRGQPNDARHD